MRLGEGGQREAENKGREAIPVAGKIGRLVGSKEFWVTVEGGSNSRRPTTLFDNFHIPL